jgi:ElaB/YqjD/DUF883 family membrane-anchored ribosome-binding protein
MDQNRTRSEAQSQPGKEPKPASVSESLNRGKDAIGAAAGEAMTAAAADLQAIRNDLNSLKDTLARFMVQAGSEAARSARDVSSRVAGQVANQVAGKVKDVVGGTVEDVAGGLADKGVEFASTAGEQAKSLAAELEAMARRNPLGALAGALAIGFLIGVWGRRS